MLEQPAQEEQPKIKQPVGRPKLPETVIKDLKARIQELEDQQRKANSDYDDLKQLAEIIRIIQRAVKGLNADEDIFQGLIQVRDIRERTRLDEAAVLGHSAMRAASDIWPELGLFGKIADMEDPYYISLDGEGRKEGILQLQAKSKLDANLVLNMPNTQGGPAQDPNNPGAQAPKKKSLIDKVLHR